jgi:regulator of protease activity HflC (stomatin/prohibitin superfamily)
MKFSVMILNCLLLVVKAFYTTIPTGFVGVPVVFGKITPPIEPSGLAFYNPVTTYIEQVETRPQSDSVLDVSCTTNEGITLVFEKIEIGNQLNETNVVTTISRYGPEYDKYLVTDLVRHEVNVLCAKSGFHQLAITEFDQLDDHLKGFLQAENDRQESGLTITFVRLTKPRLPTSIENNYLALAEEKTRKQVIEEMKARVTAEKESEMLVAQKDNTMLAQKAEAENEIMVKRMRANQEEQTVKNEMIVAEAEAQANKTKLEADALRAMYSIPGYVDVRVAEAMSANQKIYYGEKIPQYSAMLSSFATTAATSSSSPFPQMG